MDEKELRELIEKGESEKVEFKPSLSNIDKIVQSVCAMANFRGGKILIGISDTGEILGCDIGRDSVERLTNKIIDNIDYKIYPRIFTTNVNGKNIIVVDVGDGGYKPHTAFGRAYIRVGKNNKLMSKSEYDKLILEKHKREFDSEVCENATLEDIDGGMIRKFLEKAKYERGLDIDESINVKEGLEKLGLVKKDKLTNAGILLFGKNPQRFVVQSEVRCARFKGIEPIEFIDMKVFGRDIINQRDNALEFVKEHIKLSAKIIDVERVEKWEYPIEAIREAITNAICHRDYELAGNVQIRIFDDRAEIWNPGKLISGLTIEKLKEKHDSILRNLLIGKCFFLIKYIEQWGTGTNRIIDECLKHGLPEPIFEERGVSFVVTFRKYKISEDVIKELNERQRKAVKYLLENKRITNIKYRNLNLGISDRTALNDLKELVHKKIIIAKGEKKYRYYMLR